MKLAAISAAASVSCASAVADHPHRPLLIEVQESERTELAELVVGRASSPSAIFHRLTAVAGDDSSALDDSQLKALDRWAERTAALSTKKRYVAVPTSILADQDLEGEVHEMTSKIPAGVGTIVVVERGTPLPLHGDDIGVVCWSAADEDAAASIVAGLDSLVDLGA